MQVPFLSLKDVTNMHGDEIREAARRVIDSGWYLQGKENARFEKDYAEYIGTKHCIGVANGLDALYAKEAWNVSQLSLPITEMIADCELSLPISPCMTKEQVKYVVDVINEFQ